MTSGDLLKKLFSTYSKGDVTAFQSIALQIISEERRKNHHVLANQLEEILRDASSVASNYQRRSDLTQLPKDKESGAVLVEVKHPQKGFGELVVEDRIMAKLLSFIDEANHSSLLKTYGLSPKQKILFAGPPGCGKTLTAEILSYELGLPLMYTRFDSIISSYLGETASNLRKVFDYASSGKWVILFDEFDAIGKSRENTDEHGELKRVVNTFLQLLDNFASESYVIASTNHESLLDRALWRRFDEIILFEKPGIEDRKRILFLKLRAFPHKDLNYEYFAEKMDGWSHSDIERACLEAVKKSVLMKRDALTYEVMSAAVMEQAERINVIASSR